MVEFVALDQAVTAYEGAFVEGERLPGQKSHARTSADAPSTPPLASPSYTSMPGS